MNINYLLEKFMDLVSKKDVNLIDKYIELLSLYIDDLTPFGNVPFSVEFLGTPEAGKTTTIKSIIESLTRQNFSVGYIRESAEIAPTIFKKNSIEAHLWMQIMTIKEIVVAYSNKSTEILIIDRGILDTLFWDEIFIKRGDLSLSQASKIEQCLQKLIPNLVVELEISPEEAIKRRGGEGRVVTLDFIKEHNIMLKKFYKEKLINISTIFLNTNVLLPKDVSNFIEKNILNYYKQ